MKTRGMTGRKIVSHTLAIGLVFMAAFAPCAYGQPSDQPLFKQEELEQIVAPIALYPDSLLAQILMAATYPLEVVQAERWQKQNKNLKADALAKELEKQPWDASVKSLINFPEVLTMMSEKLDWTQKLGDAFLSQQKEVMETVQTLRKKAEAEGNLKSTEEQKVKVSDEAITIEPAQPQVVYVPVYNPVVVYGVWPYPAYPPYYYYPPGYAPGAVFFSFSVGVAVGATWGRYAWGGCNWQHNDIDIDIDRTTNINRGDRVSPHGDKQGKWQHNPEHRQGVAYPDQGTGQKYNRASTNEAVQSRENFRGHTEAGRQDLTRGNVGDLSAQKGNAFSGMDRGGGTARDYSSRGSTSRGMSAGGRSGGMGGGGGRGGGMR